MQTRFSWIGALTITAGLVATTPGVMAAGPEGRQPASGAPPASAALPVLTPRDYGRWEALNTQPHPLSPDGRWLVYGITRSDDTRELRVRDRESSKTVTLPFGERPAFSADSAWLADLVGMSDADEARLRKAKKPVHKKLRLTRLATGESVTIDGVESFAFNASGSHIAMRRYPQEPASGAEGQSRQGDDAAPAGATLVIRNLATGADMSLGGVSAYAWQSAGTRLAAAITVPGGVGNGVQLYDSASGQLRVLDSSASTYTGLAWREDADDLAVLRSLTSGSRDGRSHVLLAWTGLGGEGERHEYDATADATVPDDMRVMDRAPEWSKDGAVVFIGLGRWFEAIPAAPDGEAASADDLPAVEVWHPNDASVMPRQKRRASTDRRRSMLAAWHVSTGTLTRLAHSLDDIVTPLGDGRHALIVETTPYLMQRSIGRRFADVSIASLATGERTPIVTHIDDAYLEASPGGHHLLYLRDNDYWTVDLATGQSVNLTGGVRTSFIDTASDATVAQKPPFGMAGWTTDERHVWLYDELDIWQIGVDGSGATRLTAGADGRVRHRYLTLDPGSEGIDTSKPVYLSLFGVESKQSGFARLVTGGATPRVERLVLADRGMNRLVRADKADVYAYVAQSFTDSPDYFTAGPDLANPVQLTATNPFMGEYAWGRAVLVDYESERGVPLQGVLRYPADYQPGRQYPMVVYVYEKRSDTLHTFSTPSERAYYNVSAFTNHGYFQFEPDIVFRPRQPGLSVVESVRPAVEAVVKMGDVDPRRVGIIGHSWGGFDTAYLATHTTIFAAAVAGAPITDLISNYGNHHWSSGIAETDHIETGQQRMEVPLWEDVDAYVRNSPIFGVNTMSTPLLVEVGDADGTVFWHQGVELYNIARRAGKQVVLLVYNGEDHGLAKKANQIDYQRRIFQWFDHYLKDAAAPDWITKGQSYLERQREIRRLEAPSAPAAKTTSPFE